MIRRIIIKTPDNKHVHFDTGKNNYTLCGLETGGDDGLSIDIGVKTDRKVNCPDCIAIVKFCRSIKSNEYR